MELVPDNSSCRVFSKVGACEPYKNTNKILRSQLLFILLFLILSMFQADPDLKISDQPVKMVDNSFMKYCNFTNFYSSSYLVSYVRYAV